MQIHRVKDAKQQKIKYVVIRSLDSIRYDTVMNGIIESSAKPMHSLSEV